MYKLLLKTFCVAKFKKKWKKIPYCQNRSKI